MNFKYSIDNFRGLSILFVMFSHMGTLRWLGNAGDFAYFLVVDATTWFVFISGYLFRHIEFNRFKYADYLRKKTKFVLLPYAIFSIPAILAGMYFSRDVLLGLDRGSYVLWSLLVGGSVAPPMWFIPMISIVFLSSPLWHALAKTRAIYPVAAVALLISLFTHRPIHNLNPFLAFVHFFGFYLLGMLVSMNGARTDAIKQGRVIDVLIVVGLLVFFGTAFLNGRDGPGALGFVDGVGHLNLIQLGKLGLLTAVFLLFERFLNVRQRVLAYLAEISFGLFFVHGFFILMSNRIRGSVAFSSPWLAFLFESAFVVLGSILTVYVAKLVFKKKSRYVVGC